MKDDTDQESTYKDVLSVLSVDLYKEFTRSLEQPDRYAGWTTRLQSVPYNNGVFLDDNSPLVTSSQLHEILRKAENQFGVIYQNFLVLKVQQHISSNNGVLIFVEDSQLQEMLKTIYPNHMLTPAEARTLKQLLCGESLKDAATNDNVAYETKRTHFKSLCNKIGLRRQTDIVTYTITRLLVGNHPVESTAAMHANIRDYHEAHLPESTRLHIMVGENGWHHRIIDMGPLDGMTLICLHPQIFPGFRKADIETLYARHVRLLWPLRQGQLSPQDTIFEFNDHLQHYHQTIDMARSLQLDTNELTLVSLVSGDYYGIEYASRFNQVNTLVIVGASYKSAVSNTNSDKFRYGLLKLATANMALARKLLHFFGKKFKDKNVLSAFFLKLYGDCEADLSVLDEEFSSERTFTAMQRRMLESENSIVHDFYAHASPNWHQLKTLDCHFSFVHGQLDPAHPVNEIKSLAASHNAPVYELEGLGQLLYYDHFNELLEKIERSIVYQKNLKRRKA